MKYTLHTLGNGVPVHVVQGTSQIARVHFLFGTGSFDEDKTSWGISHAIEHLMFSANKYGQQAFADLFSECGAGQNAWTATTQTEFHFHCHPEDIQDLTNAFLEVFKTFKVTPELLEKEKVVILQELRDRKEDNWSQAHEAFYSQLYRTHPMHVPVIGFEDTIKGLTPEQLQSWYESHFSTNNLTIFIMGPAEEYSENFWAMLEAFELNKEATISHPEISDAQRSPVYSHARQTFPDWQQNILIYSWNVSRTSPAPFYIAEHLCGSMSSVLWQELREKDSIAYTLAADVGSFDDSTAQLWVCTSFSDNDKLEKQLNIIKEAQADLVNITEDRFNSLKRRLAVSIGLAKESSRALILRMMDALDAGRPVDPGFLDSFLLDLTYEEFMEFCKDFQANSPIYFHCTTEA